MNARTLAGLKRGFIAVFVIGVMAFTLSIIYDEVSRNQDLRAKASGSRVSNTTFCKGKEMCPDNRCVGETWRECNPCPMGKARSVYRVACGEDIYSDCVLTDEVCDDR